MFDSRVSKPSVGRSPKSVPSEEPGKGDPMAGRAGSLAGCAETLPGNPLVGSRGNRFPFGATSIVDARLPVPGRARGSLWLRGVIVAITMACSGNAPK